MASSSVLRGNPAPAVDWCKGKVKVHTSVHRRRKAHLYKLKDLYTSTELFAEGFDTKTWHSLDHHVLEKHTELQKQLPGNQETGSLPDLLFAHKHQLPQDLKAKAHPGDAGHGSHHMFTISGM